MATFILILLLLQRMTMPCLKTVLVTEQGDRDGFRKES